jgi:hypothetical protein
MRFSIHKFYKFDSFFGLITILYDWSRRFGQSRLGQIHATAGSIVVAVVISGVPHQTACDGGSLGAGSLGPVIGVLLEEAVVRVSLSLDRALFARLAVIIRVPVHGDLARVQSLPRSQQSVVVRVLAKVPLIESGAQAVLACVLRPRDKLRVPLASVHALDLLFAEAAAEQERVVEEYLSVVVMRERVLHGALRLANFELGRRDGLGDLTIQVRDFDARLGSFVAVVPAWMLSKKNQL